MTGRKRAFVPAVLLFLVAVFAASGAAIAAEPETPHKKFFVPPPPFSPGIFPCSQCHAGMPANRQTRKLDMHQEITLNHMPGGWCFDCHNPSNRDTLRLANGKTVPFSESYNLCAQCHGLILREWKAGLHGKRTGSWNGEKQYRLCVHCHWPHDPRFKPLKPLPPPVRPNDIR